MGPAVQKPSSSSRRRGISRRSWTCRCGSVSAPLPRISDCGRRTCRAPDRVVAGSDARPGAPQHGAILSPQPGPASARACRQNLPDPTARPPARADRAPGRSAVAGSALASWPRRVGMRSVAFWIRGSRRRHPTCVALRARGQHPNRCLQVYGSTHLLDTALQPPLLQPHVGVELEGSIGALQHSGPPGEFP